LCVPTIGTVTACRLVRPVAHVRAGDTSSHWWSGVCLGISPHRDTLPATKFALLHVIHLHVIPSMYHSAYRPGYNKFTVFTSTFFFIYVLIPTHCRHIHDVRFEYCRNIRLYEGVSKSFRTGRLERELQMVQLSATRWSCITIL
jgi:hypothetical protein